MWSVWTLRDTPNNSNKALTVLYMNKYKNVLIELQDVISKDYYYKFYSSRVRTRQDMIITVSLYDKIILGNG